MRPLLPYRAWPLLAATLLLSACSDNVSQRALTGAGIGAAFGAAGGAIAGGDPLLGAAIGGVVGGVVGAVTPGGPIPLGPH